MLRAVAILGALTLAGGAAAQPAGINDRPTVVATGTGQVTRTPEFVRIGFSVRGEGATPTEALSAVARQRAAIEAGVRSLRGITSAQVSNTQLSTQDVRGPSCSPSQPYLATQRLSVGECAIVGSIATMELEAKVYPAAKAGDVASMATQLGAKSIGVRGSGFENDSALQDEAAEKAVADARREAELVARAAGARLGQVLRIQDAVFPTAYSNVESVVVTGSRVQPFPEAPAPPPPPPPPLAVPLTFTPQPVTRTARVTLVFALEPGAGQSR